MYDVVLNCISPFACFHLDYKDKIKSVNVSCSSLIEPKCAWLPFGWTDKQRETDDRKPQFLTETDFIQAKKLIQQNKDELRRDTDKTIAFLTYQLKDKFVLLETKLSEVDKQNVTINDCVSMEKYLALEQKLTSVQKENEQMKQGNKAVKNELLSLKRILPHKTLT